MAAFADPFSGKSPPDKLSKEELARAIRQDLAAEHEATNLYEAHADATNEPLAKKVLQNIADEEKAHAGEFNALLDVITGDEGKFQQQGEDEVVAAIESLPPTLRGLVTNIPRRLQPLADEAVKYDTFDDFQHAFLIELKHGRYYHITDDPNFTIDPLKGPRDMSSMAEGAMDPGHLMITSDLSHWASQYPERKYVAIIDMSDVPPEAYRQINRGFGNEFFVDDPSEARVLKVVRMDTAKRDEREYQRALEDAIHGPDDLQAFYQTVQFQPPGFRPAIADAKVIYQDRNAGGGWYRVFSAIPSGMNPPRNWNFLSERDVKAYQSWIDRGHGGKTYATAVAWRKVALDPWKEIEQREAEYEERQRIEQEGTAREKRIADALASPEYGLTNDEIKQLKVGQTIEVAWYEEPQIITEIHDDEVYVRGISEPEGETSGFVGKDGIKRTALRDVRPAQATEPWQMTRERFEDRAKQLGIKVRYTDAEIPNISSDLRTITLPQRNFNPSQAEHELLHAIVNDDTRVGYVNEIFRQNLSNPQFRREAEIATRMMFDDVSMDRILTYHPPHEIVTELWSSGQYKNYPELRKFLKETLEVGKPIPPEVLAEYPNLAQVRGARADGSPIVVRFGASERKYNHTIAAFERAGLPFYDYMADMGHYPWRYGLMNDTEEARELLKEQGGSIARSGSAPSLPRLEVLAWQYPKLAEGASRAVRIRPAALPPTLGDIDMDEINAMVEDLHNEVSNMSAKLGAPDPITGGLKTWLASVGGLPGIVEDPNAAADTPCIAAELEEGESLIFSPGIIGALDEEQRQLYCQNGMERRELTEEQRARLSALQDAARTCGAETGGLDPNIQPFFTCLGRELRAKGEDVW